MKPTIPVTISLITAASLFTLWSVGFLGDGVNIVNVRAAGAANPQDNSSERAHGKTCSLRTLQGTHGYTYSGTALGLPVAAAGPITFDGEGNLSAPYTVSVGGQTFKGHFTGTYIINDGCTGSVTLDLPWLDPKTATGDFVIVNDGQETFFVAKDPGFTVNGVTKRQ